MNGYEPILIPLEAINWIITSYPSFFPLEAITSYPLDPLDVRNDQRVTTGSADRCRLFGAGLCLPSGHHGLAAHLALVSLEERGEDHLLETWPWGKRGENRGDVGDS